MNLFSKSNKKLPSWKHMAMLCLTLCMSLGATVYAQNKSISGRVVDQRGEALIGASVKLVGSSTVGTITDMDGKYSISVPAGSTLEVSFIGCTTEIITVGAGNVYDVTLKDDANLMDEVVVVGYGAQKKATLTGAVSAIGNEQLVTTKNQNAQNMLTGKIPGVRVVQQTSEPGQFNNYFDIRGFGAPLIVVDGIPRGNLERLDPNDIESISVLKDAAAAIYGMRAANGVILVTTKSGQRERTTVEYNMYFGLQTPADVLRPVDAIGRMTLFNERGYRDLVNPTHKYSQDQLDEFISGKRESVDWYGAVLRDIAPQHSHNITVRGGGEKVDYFVSFGYSNQEGFFQKDALNYNRFNVRSNINANVTKNLTLSVKLAAILDNRKGASTDSWEVYKNLWRSATDEPLYANNTAPYYIDPISADDNPYALIDPAVTGWKKNSNNIMTSSFEGVYKFPFLKGLSAKGLFSFDKTFSQSENYTKAYKFYSYNEAADMYNATTRKAPTNLVKQDNTSSTRLWQVSLNYDNTFGKNHVGALILYEEAYNQSDNLYAKRNVSMEIPYLFAGDSKDQIGTGNGLNENSSKGLVGRFNYDYASKYLAEFAFRYDGSSKFPTTKQWGFFPSVSLGWRISEEPFIKDNLNWINNLKIRGSYGVMGDDGASQYQFISGYDYPNTSGGSQNNSPTGYIFNGNYTNALGFRAAANPNITWYTATTANVGIDGEFWKGLFGFSFDMFQRDRKGLLATRLATLPGTFGSTMPQENLNSDRTKGLELELRHHNRIGEFSYGVTGQVSLTRSMRLFYETTPASNSYDYWRNRTLDRYNDIFFGYGKGGRYTSYDQIFNSMYSGSGTLPGDYYYEDWNEDGTIDDNDRYPIATMTSPGSGWQDRKNYPLMNYGINLNAEWKGIDVNLMFQGAALSYVAYGEQLTQPLAWDGNALDMFLDRWHPTDPEAFPYNPTTTWESGYYSFGATTPDGNSAFMIQKGDYLRLKTAEIGYSFPKKWLQKVKIQQLRIFFNGYNLFTITDVMTVDPERPTNLYGYMYPLNRTFNIGLNVKF